ncbi:MAG: hypothetical protein JXB62_16845 [Pirellulales bacterium]|nr:hypothetical protein [Pirellulales bacterium]
MYRSLSLLAGGMVMLWGVSLCAQDAVLAQKYGSGVHAYFSHDYVGAYDNLTEAIQAGTKDPRAFYFRGLTYLRLGRETEAGTDFQKGAELESGDLNRFYHVAKSLERIQGNARVTLEEYRLEARMAARQRAEELRKARYDTIRREEHQAVQEQVDAAPGVPADVPAVPPDSDPFQLGPTQGPAAEPAAIPAAEPAAEPVAIPAAEPAMEPATDPFAAEPATEPFDVEPAATPAVVPSAEPPAAVPGEKKASRVFGGLLRALGKAAVGDSGGPADVPPGAEPLMEPGADPFGAEPPVEPAAGPAADPFGAEPAAEPAAQPGADPFGAEPPAQPAAEPAADPFADDPTMEPAGEPAAEPATDPFADDEPVAQPAGGTTEVDPANPFGG